VVETLKVRDAKDVETAVREAIAAEQPLEIVDGLLVASGAEADPRVEWLYRQIAQLKASDRSVALLMLDGFAYKEIAAIAGISDGNVAVKINRIKATLTAQLAKEAAL